MSLKLVQTQDWSSGTFGYAPPTVDTLINTDLVASARVCEARGNGPWYEIILSTGASFIARGKPTDLLNEVPS